jgi:hypothetical protein
MNVIGINVLLTLKFKIYWNITIYAVSILFIKITEKFLFSYVSELRNMVIGCAQDRSMIAKLWNLVQAG